MSWEDIAMARAAKPAKEQAQEMLGEIIIAIPEGRKGLMQVAHDWLSGTRHAAREEARKKEKELAEKLKTTRTKINVAITKLSDEDGTPMPAHGLDDKTVADLHKLLNEIFTEL